MHADKKTTITSNKTATNTGSAGKGETISEERATLIRASRLPSYLQRRSVGTEEEEKKKEIMRKQAASQSTISLKTKH